MSWILDEAEVTLRSDGYSSVRLSDPNTFAFESETTFGFVIEYDTARDLVERWQAGETGLLSRFAPALRSSGEKAWNVYTVVLTGDASSDPDVLLKITNIEENLRHTRKIPRQSIRAPADVKVALSPLLAIAAQTTLKSESFADRLARRLDAEIGEKASELFLSTADVETVARGFLEGEQ